MSPKRAILGTLKGASHVRPATIPGWDDQPGRYQEAVNELLQARLVEGRRDADGHMTISLNEHRRRDVERMLRPLWARPGVWIALLALAAVGTALVVA